MSLPRDAASDLQRLVDRHGLVIPHAQAAGDGIDVLLPQQPRHRLVQRRRQQPAVDDPGPALMLRPYRQRGDVVVPVEMKR